MNIYIIYEFQMSIKANNSIRPPSRWLIIRESMALVDLAFVPLSLLESKIAKKQNVERLPIIMLPGFGTDERYLKPLEYYLQNLGYMTEGWGLGTNLAGVNLKHTLEDLSDTWGFEYPENYSPTTYKGEGGVPFLCDKVIAHVKKRSDQLNSPVVLIGWSLGGFIARECARELPNQVAQIITFGAPIIGGPKYTRASDYFRARKYDLDWIEESIERRNCKDITQPITNIYSKSDGIVSSAASIDLVSSNVTNIEVNSSHIGMGFNYKIWKIIRSSLETRVSKNDEQ